MGNKKKHRKANRALFNAAMDAVMTRLLNDSAIADTDAVAALDAALCPQSARVG